MSANRIGVRRAIIAGLAVLLIAGQLVNAPPADAAVPGLNGRIVFSSSDYSLFTMNTDGSALTRLSDSSDTGQDYDPQWSPNGGMIAYSNDASEIRTIKPNGPTMTPAMLRCLPSTTG